MDPRIRSWVLFARTFLEQGNMDWSGLTQLMKDRGLSSRQVYRVLAEVRSGG